MATEKRLIYADDARREILREAPEMAYIIDRIKPADAVEIVRCKDCKHWHEETGFCEEHSRFDSFGMDWNMFAEDDFCSYGERKDND